MKSGENRVKVTSNQTGTAFLTEGKDLLSFLCLVVTP